MREVYILPCLWWDARKGREVNMAKKPDNQGVEGVTVPEGFRLIRKQDPSKPRKVQVRAHLGDLLSLASNPTVVDFGAWVAALNPNERAAIVKIAESWVGNTEPK